MVQPAYEILELTFYAVSSPKFRIDFYAVAFGFWTPAGEAFSLIQNKREAENKQRLLRRRIVPSKLGPIYRTFTF